MVKHALLLGAIIIAAALQTEAMAAPKVLASVKPVHSLVAAVMQGVAEPGLIVDGAGSPHAYSLKPSQARGLEQADIIVWIGPDLEVFLEKPIATLGSNAMVVELSKSPGLTRLAPRRGGTFEAHEDEPAMERGGAADPAELKGAAHGSDDEAQRLADAHLWLDPENARVFVREIETTLSRVDPANTAVYRANAQRVSARLDALTREIDAVLRPVRDRPFIVFHDAYQYFEDRFSLSSVGSITVSPEVMPGAERLAEIQAKVKSSGVACVFAEPQFEPKLVAVAIERTDARSAVLDPLGAEITNGPDLYFTLLQDMANTFRSCLSGGD